ncbi:MAG: alpha/beta hydrolase [Bryobacteraceae bacterium]|nr:alpha/beta hydrolase [Bryobacteraceae bacterium]
MTKLAAGLLLARALFAATAVSEGVHVNYESYGKGREALVFVHGWTCDLTFWRGQAPVYQKYRSLLIDLPGHGESGKPEVAYTQERFARAIEAVMKKEGVDRGVLIGHSMGGPVAITFLRLFPSKVKGVVMVDSFIPPGESTPDERKQWDAMAGKFSAVWRGADWKDQAAKFVASMYSEKTNAAVKAEIASKMIATPNHVRASAFEEMFKMPGPKSGESYDVPAAAVVVPSSNRPGAEERTRSLFPKLSKYEVWDGYGHFLMMEDPAKFNRSLEEFVATLK